MAERLRICAALAFVAIASALPRASIAQPVTAAVSSPPGASAPAASTPIDRYRAALAALAPLKDMVFQYAESRTGPARTIVEEHRVYRRVDGAERNETIAVDGAQVVPAIVHLESAPAWPYDVRAFSVSAADYEVMPLGARVVDGKRAFGLSAVRTSNGDFAVTAIFLDEKRWLPLRETFDVSGGGCAGTGSIDFEPVGTAWLPASTKVSCAVGEGGPTFKESITFSEYSFPLALPSEIFGAQS